MRLEIGSNIDNKRVRLDFRKDNTRAVYMPSYQIKTANADEFVAKYNKQSSSLKKLTAVLVGGLAILGGILGAKSEKKIWKLFGVIAGALSGLGVGAIISKEKRNKLMDKYEVKDISE